MNSSEDLVSITRNQLEHLQYFQNALNEHGIQYFNAAMIALSNKPCKFNIYEYGCTITKNGSVTFYPTHNAGLFSVFSTIMWTILDIITNNDPLPSDINNTLTMFHFKESQFTNNYSYYFTSPSTESFSNFVSRAPITLGRYDNRGDYFHVMQQLGSTWVSNYLKCYMNPTQILEARINFFIFKYNLRSKRSLAVLYRGTDREIIEDSLNTYIQTCQRKISENQIDQVIIQTEQIQIRERFMSEFDGKCIFITELPGTKGDLAMHFEPSFITDKKLWTLDLIAMTFALAECHTIVTYTGNIGLYLSLISQLKGADVIQLR